MRRLSRGKESERICVPIVERTVEKARKVVEEATPVADLIELRLDYLRRPEITPLMKGRRKPFIITNRRREEGGRYGGDEERRFEILKEAIELGAEYVDVEMRSRGSLVQDLIANKEGTKIILSFHDFQGTPSQRDLRDIFSRMVDLGADIIKIVTFARSWEDNFLLLSLLSHAKERRQQTVALCMGERGRMSRVFAPRMGAAWTYAPLRRDRSSAPGQLT
ncbi:MAG: type I 3-dehydroquinate dehydratase, partial [Syntrophaceae bacterium]|nr:type I 3-dehydroquinate dehydratase [Syntrophaceae bacterium]